MHPYEVATTLRQRQMHESVRLNYGSLYAVVESLERRSLIIAERTERSGRLPERTIYAITDAGRIEMHDWLTGLVSTPVNDYPEFGAALCFLPALAPVDVVDLLKERGQRLEFQLATMASARDLCEKQGIPRLFLIEVEFHRELLEVELGYVQRLIREVEAGTIEGYDWWRETHDHAGEQVVTLPFVQ
jgi:DNA-binding PadR family transcriptional regulator